MAILAIAALIIGGGLSLLASSNPDGLEWSLFGNQDGGYSENLGLAEDAYGVTSRAGTQAEKIIEKTALLPDYAFANDPENQAGTSVARGRRSRSRRRHSGARLPSRQPAPPKETAF